MYDSSYDYPLTDKFAGAPLSQVRQALSELGEATEYARTPYTFLAISPGEHWLLIDMGTGHWGRPSGRLTRSLEAAGIDPRDIDMIVITHAHPDHIGGTLGSAGNLVYSNAEYYVSEDEWDFWFSDQASSEAAPWFVSLARNSLQAIEDQVHLVHGETEILPGITLMPAPGHTPGHMVVSVLSAGQLLLYAADTATHVLHLAHPEWHPRYDMDRDAAAATKRWVFDWAAEQGSLVVGTHFGPFPSLGTVVKLDKGWQWQPVETGQ